MTTEYDDIINLPHPVSSKYPQMSLQNRASQFAPFAALSGFSEAIEKASTTSNPIQFDSENLIQQLLSNVEFDLVDY